MHPWGGYKYAWPEDRGDMSRTAAKRHARAEADDQLASVVHDRETDHEASTCPYGCIPPHPGYEDKAP